MASDTEGSALPPVRSAPAVAARAAPAARAGGARRRARAGRPARSARLTYTRDLLLALVLRDMKIHYEGTALGFAWMLAKPLLFVGVFFFVFQVVLTLDVPRFTAFAFVGILAYGWFQSALIAASSVAFDNRDLVRRPQ